MGWDYWMRTAFRREDKECIIPEVSRARHAGHPSKESTGQVNFFRAMAFAEAANTCGVAGSCRQFGDVSYLERETYDLGITETIHHSLIIRAEDLAPRDNFEMFSKEHECAEQTELVGVFNSPHACAEHLLQFQACSHFMWSATTEWGCRCCAEDREDGGPEHKLWHVYTTVTREKAVRGNLQIGRFNILPYDFDEWQKISDLVGLAPKGAVHAIPKDARSEHYGVMYGRHVASRAPVMLVDRRSSRGFLPLQYRIQMIAGVHVTAGQPGESCQDRCSSQHMKCDAQQLHFLNDCRTLEEHFQCKYCAQQVGEELPAFVQDPEQSTYEQCLVTFLSPLTCDGKHASVRRLCACLPL